MKNKVKQKTKGQSEVKYENLELASKSLEQTL